MLPRITVTRRPASPEERRDLTNYYTWDGAVDGDTVASSQPGWLPAYRAALATIRRDSSSSS